MRTGKFRTGDVERIGEGGSCAADLSEAVQALLNVSPDA
ncbi:MAG: hypothetical protein NFW05_13670 [Candidatus Accumulibacter sp.]|nr:hypothetical protein [Accumulibacter sp.]